MKYKLLLSEKARKNLKKLDQYTASVITVWLRKNLLDCDNPRLHGKALAGDKSGQWRYRVGDYRIIAEIQDQEIIILVLTIARRKDIYN